MENKKIKISENLEEVLLQEEAIIIIDRKLEDSELKQIKEKNNSTIFFIKDTYQNNYNFDNYTISEEDKLVTLKDIVTEELRQKKLPLMIRRYFSDNSYEDWRLKDMYYTV